MTTPAFDVARAEFPAFGGTAVVLSAAPDRLDSACAAARAEIEAMDSACSRLRADSELSRVNANAGRSVPVSDLFAEAMVVALRAARLTDGAVDPTRAAAVIRAGDDQHFEPARTGRTRVSTTRLAATPGWRSIEWNPRRQSVRIQPGSLLELGATAGALAADRAAYAAHRAAGCGVLVSLGGDLAVQGQSPDGGWRVTMADDHHNGTHNGVADREANVHAGAPGQIVSITEGGLATSSAALHGWITISVAAITCVDASIAATAAMVRGESAARWLTDLGLPARLVHEDGSVLILANWPAASIPPDVADAPDRP